MARDIIHDAVKNALIKDGWTITADPYVIEYEELTLFADLAAEDRSLAAERAGRKIAVEIKSFVHPSVAQDLKNALGQYELYRSLLTITDPDRELLLAISQAVYHRLFKQKVFRFITQRHQLKLLVVNVQTEEVVEWIS